MNGQIQVSQEEIAALIGVKDIEIMVLQKQVIALQKRLSELEPKPDSKDA